MARKKNRRALDDKDDLNLDSLKKRKVSKGIIYVPNPDIFCNEAIVKSVEDIKANCIDDEQSFQSREYTFYRKQHKWWLNEYVRRKRVMEEEKRNKNLEEKDGTKNQNCQNDSLAVMTVDTLNKVGDAYIECDDNNDDNHNNYIDNNHKNDTYKNDNNNSSTLNSLVVDIFGDDTDTNNTNESDNDIDDIFAKDSDTDNNDA